MSVKVMDQVFSRWFLDSEFRTQMNEAPELALAGYNLTEAEREKLSILSRKKRRQTKKSVSKPTTKINHIIPNRFRYAIPGHTQARFSLN